MEGVRGPGLQAGESGRPLLKHRRGRPLEKSRLAETLTPRAKANVKSPESTLCKYQAGKCCARGAAGHLGAPRALGCALIHFAVTSLGGGGRARAAGALRGRGAVCVALGPRPCLMEQKTDQQKPGRCGGRASTASGEVRAQSSRED